MMSPGEAACCFVRSLLYEIFLEGNEERGLFLGFGNFAQPAVA
jgi:hypothetical protein